MADAQATHGFAAFDPADVDDARRGRPDADLAAYAEERGLEFFPEASGFAGFGQAMPRVKEHGFNLMRGVLPGGEYGVLFHEAWQIESTGEGSSRRLLVPGPYYGAVHKGRGSANLLSFIPVIGEVLGRSSVETETQIVPSTVAALHLPEATGVAPAFWIRSEERAGKHAGEKLDGVGLPGFKLHSDEKPGEPPVTEELRALIADGQTAEVIRSWQGAGFFEIRFAYGTLVLRCNGYLPDPDRLARDAVAVRRHLAEALAPLNAPRAPEDELGPPREIDISIPPEPQWQNGFNEFAERHGLVFEDTLEFHRAFPRMPHPGQAVAVMRGQGRRVVYYSQHYVGERQQVVGGLLARAATGAENTPPGGVRLPEQKLVYEVRDGLALVWSLEAWGWQWATDDTFLERASTLDMVA